MVKEQSTEAESKKYINVRTLNQKNEVQRHHSTVARLPAKQQISDIKTSNHGTAFVLFPK